MQSGLDVQRVADEYGDAAALLLDSHQPGGVGGTGQVFDWSAIPELPIPVILAGGLTAANVRQAVEQVKPWAVDVSSGVEDAPGRKNADQMREFIREAKREY
jgi:phosphoribosylanthranilate isomerase